MTVSVLVADDHTQSAARSSKPSKRADDSLSPPKPGTPTAVQAALTTQPQLCLLDIRMPGNGLAAAWEITARLPQTKVVMLTVSRNDNDLFAALRAGASGYLLKDVDINHLLDALDEVMADEPAISHELIPRLVAEFRDRSARRRSVLRPPPQGDPLTSREWEVLDLLRKDQTTADIARTLTLSQATVRSHIAAILRKLRVPDRAAAIQLLESQQGTRISPQR